MTNTGIKMPVPDCMSYLGVERGRCTLEHGFTVGELKRDGQLGQNLNRLVRRLLESIRNGGGMNT
jgi:hypothetical protein